jgi:hypothetical protein
MIRLDFTFSKAGLALLPILPLLAQCRVGAPPSAGPVEPEPDCRAWLEDAATWTETTSEYAEAGTVVHKALAPLVKGGILELPEKPGLRAMFGYAKAWLLEHRFVKHAKDGQRHPIFSLRAEVVFAYDVETREGRELADLPGLEGTRWYVDAELRAKHGIRPSEICGRLDLVGQGIDDLGAFAIVDDYKFHFGPEMSEAVGQLAMGGLAVCKALGFERVKVTGVHVWEDREPVLEQYEFTDWELDTVAVRIDELAHPLAANDPSPHGGAHCKAMRCPARAGCALGGEVVAEIVPAPLVPAGALVRAAHPFLRPVATNEDAAWALVAIDLLEELVAAKKAEVKAFADAKGGILLSNGTVYSGAVQNRTAPDLSVPGAIEAMQKLGLDFAMKTSTTWSAIKEHGGSEGEKAARAALELANAVKKSMTTVYMARKVETAAKAGRKAS